MPAEDSPRKVFPASSSPTSRYLPMWSRIFWNSSPMRRWYHNASFDIGFINAELTALTPPIAAIGWSTRFAGATKASGRFEPAR
jgi:hypothetical protein